MKESAGPRALVPGDEKVLNGPEDGAVVPHNGAVPAVANDVPAQGVGMLCPPLRRLYPTDKLNDALVPEQTKLKSSDGDVIVVEKKFILRCVKLYEKVIAGEFDADGCIVLENAKTEALKKVVEFVHSPVYPHLDEKLSKEFFTGELTKVMSLVCAADCVGNEPLTLINCKMIAGTIKGASIGEIKHTLGQAGVCRGSSMRMDDLYADRAYSMRNPTRARLRQKLMDKRYNAEDPQRRRIERLMNKVKTMGPPPGMVAIDQSHTSRASRNRRSKNRNGRSSPPPPPLTPPPPNALRTLPSQLGANPLRNSCASKGHGPGPGSIGHGPGPGSTTPTKKKKKRRRKRKKKNGSGDTPDNTPTAASPSAGESPMSPEPQAPAADGPLQNGVRSPKARKNSSPPLPALPEPPASYHEDLPPPMEPADPLEGPRAGSDRTSTPEPPENDAPPLEPTPIEELPEVLPTPARVSSEGLLGELNKDPGQMDPDRIAELLGGAGGDASEDDDSKQPVADRPPPLINVGAPVNLDTRSFDSIWIYMRHLEMTIGDLQGTVQALEQDRDRQAEEILALRQRLDEHVPSKT